MTHTENFGIKAKLFCNRCEYNLQRVFSLKVEQATLRFIIKLKRFRSAIHMWFRAKNLCKYLDMNLLHESCALYLIQTRHWLIFREAALSK